MAGEKPDQKKKQQPDYTGLIIFLILLLAISVLGNVLLFTSIHRVGSTGTDTSENGEKINIVYIGLTSKIYDDIDSTSSKGAYYELLSRKEIAETIDSGGYPIALEYWATTPDNKRFLVELQLSGDSSPRRCWISIPETTPAETE